MNRIILVMMIISLVIFFWLCNPVRKLSKENKELEPYLNELKQKQRPPSAKNFILGLFRNHDIVVLCERDHSEFTQYELITDIIRDKEFAKYNPVIFTEIGSRSLQTLIDSLNNAIVPDHVLDSLLARIGRNNSFYPFWNNSNFLFLVQQIYYANKKLHHKIRYFPSDLFFNWEAIKDTSDYNKFWREVVPHRDSLIAAHIISTYNSFIRKGIIPKALIILNYRHAFNNRFIVSGQGEKNAGAYLFEEYNNRITNIYLCNKGISIGTDGRIKNVAVQNGKWDASFRLKKISNTGFLLAKTQFGKDSFDIWPFKNSYKFEDIFDGLVYYKYPEKHQYASGWIGLTDSIFYMEYKRRVQLFNKARASNTNILSLNDFFELNKIRKTRPPGIDSVLIQINKWNR